MRGVGTGGRAARVPSSERVERKIHLLPFCFIGFSKASCAHWLQLFHIGFSIISLVPSPCVGRMLVCHHP